MVYSSDILFWHSIWHFYLAFFSDILFGILCGIYTNIFSGIPSGIFSAICSGIRSGRRKKQSKIRCVEEGCVPWNENDINMFSGDLTGLAWFLQRNQTEERTGEFLLLGVWPDGRRILFCMVLSRYLFSNNLAAEWNIKVCGLIFYVLCIHSTWLIFPVSGVLGATVMKGIVQPTIPAKRCEYEPTEGH